MYVCCCLGVGKAVLVSSVGDDIPTEPESRMEPRRRCAAKTRRLVAPAGSASVPSGSCDRSRKMVDEAFDHGMNHFRYGLSL